MSGSRIDQLLAAARDRLGSRPGPGEVAKLQADGALLVDIRPAALRARDGEVPGALVIERNVLEWRLDPTSADRLPEVTGDPAQQVVVFCDEGFTSSLAAVALRDLGLERATDLDGGFQAWKAAGLPAVAIGAGAIEADGERAVVAPNAHRFAELPPARKAFWESMFERLDGPYLPHTLGFVIDEVRLDYARMRLPYQPELNQPAGVVHGGAIASLIDTSVVPAISSIDEQRLDMLTLHMGINYVGAVRAQDVIAEAWVEKRGRKTLFCRVEARAADGSLAATAELVYQVRPRTPPT
jgi:uncharacterized protein (TIGR00369 family)